MNFSLKYHKKKAVTKFATALYIIKNLSYRFFTLPEPDTEESIAGLPL